MEYEKKIHKRPSHRDGTKYEFNCCKAPDVWLTKSGDIICKICGEDWTDQIEI